jgi:hypothetical protein
MEFIIGAIIGIALGFGAGHASTDQKIINECTAQSSVVLGNGVRITCNPGGN